MAKPFDKLKDVKGLRSFVPSALENIGGAGLAGAAGPPLVAGGLLFAGTEIVGPLLRKLFQKDQRLQKGVDIEGLEQRKQLLQKVKERRLQRSMAENAAILAAKNPQLYNEVLAGRRLAPGERVIGGNKRTDLLEQLALQMSQGQFQRPQDIDDQTLMELLK